MSHSFGAHVIPTDVIILFSRLIGAELVFIHLAGSFGADLLMQAPFCPGIIGWSTGAVFPFRRSLRFFNPIL